MLESVSTEILAKELGKLWPGVKLKNTTPVAVYGEGFK